jgi:predicted nucleic acid-binding protein
VIVIADTSSLNYLVRMHQAEVLRTLYGRVVVPHAVRDEMLANGAPHEVCAWAAQLPDWVDLVSALHLDFTLPERLGAGEREAISLALEMSADVVLMDDQPGRLAAEERGLFVSGTLSVLLQAARLNMLDFELAMVELKALGFRMSDAIEATMRRLSKPSDSLIS